MRPAVLLFAVAALAGLASFAWGCGGGSSRGGGSTSAARRSEVGVPPHEGGPANYLVGHDEYSKPLHHYYDDGLRVAYYGYLAAPAQRRSIGAVVERYYALGAAGAGARACALMAPQLARAVPQEYGPLSRSSGSSKVHAAGTCAGVVAGMFAAHRRELRARPAVTAVFVDGENAYALIGSRTMRPRYMSLTRGGGGGGAGWSIDAPFAAQIM